MSAPQILVATASRRVVVNGRPVKIRRGRTTAQAGHPVVDGVPDLWAPLVVDYPAPLVAPGRPPGPKPADVRAWARENDVEVPARGKIPDEVVERYQAATE